VQPAKDIADMAAIVNIAFFMVCSCEIAAERERFALEAGDAKIMPQLMGLPVREALCSFLRWWMD
jgi:hypothetical protein